MSWFWSAVVFSCVVLSALVFGLLLFAMYSASDSCVLGSSLLLFATKPPTCLLQGMQDAYTAGSLSDVCHGPVREFSNRCLPASGLTRCPKDSQAISSLRVKRIIITVMKITVIMVSVVVILSPKIVVMIVTIQSSQNNMKK